MYTILSKGMSQYSFLFSINFRYSWCSENLTSDKFHWSEGLHVSDLIPLEKKTGMTSTRPGNKRIVIGHNIGFDRSFVKEQYFIKVNIGLDCNFS